MKKIVTIGGGTGHFTLLIGLKYIEELAITAITSMMDSGKSSGLLRVEWGVLPPSDLFRCLLALSPLSDDPRIRKLLLHRFERGDLQGHSIGNIITAGSSKLSNIIDTVLDISEWLELAPNHRVLPVTTDDVHLVARSKAGIWYRSEDAIGTRGESSPFEEILLVPEAKAHPAVLEAIRDADLIALDPGDLVTSIIANLLVQGVPEAIQKSKAKLLYVMNIMTRFAETSGFKASDHVQMIEKYLGRKVDFVVCNSLDPEPDVLAKYAEEQAYPVELDIRGEYDGRLVIASPLLAKGEIARHDSKRLASKIAFLLGK
jgi:uncharacterized cofD-like protein